MDALRPYPFLAVALAMTAACTPVSPVPNVEGLEPAWGYSGADTPVTVLGSGFLPLVAASGADEIDVDDDFRLFIATVPPIPLGGVERISESSLQAVVPAGIEPGRYDVRIEGPSGGAGVLVDGFTVTDTQAATVGVATAAVRFDVGEDARVDLQLRDLSGNDVPESVRVEIQAVPASGDPSGVVFRPGLQGQEAVAPGVIRGALDSGGGADLYFTSTAVDDIALRIVGLDLNTHIDVTSPELRFEPAAIEQIGIELGEGPFVAGVPTSVELKLLDQDGNQTRGELLVATVQETCALGGQAYLEVVTIADQLTLPEVIFMGATVDGACDENRLRVVGVVAGEAIVAETGPLEILPGELARYGVTPVADSVVAGVESQTILVVAEDNWGNPVVEHVAELVLTDNVGGLDSELGPGSADCSPFRDGRAICSALLEVAGPAVAVRVADARGNDGVSRGFEVEAGPPSVLNVSLPVGPFEAGESMLIQVQARDDYGNPASIEALDGGDGLQLSDTTGSLACVARFDGPTPGLVYSMCTISTASPVVQILARMDTAGLVATSDPFEVTNAPLASIEFSLASSAVTAGTPLDFGLQTFDAYGNPYRLQSASTVVVSDSDGDASPTSVILDGEGEGTGTVTLTRASTTNRLQGRVFGTVYGESEILAVHPGPHAGFAVDMGAPWVELLEERSVRIDAVDAYGNTLDDVDTIVQVSSIHDATEAQPGLVMTGGGLDVFVTWDRPWLQDQILVEDDAISSTSGPIDILDFDCAEPPSAVLTLAGETDLRLCLVSGQTSAVSLSAAASIEGAAGFAAYHFDPGTGNFSRGSQDTTTHRWTGEGGRLVQVVVVDEAACADLGAAHAWVGASNGQPVGPVSVQPDDATLVAGSVSGGDTTVFVAAWDCAGDPASGGAVSVRADLGALSSGTSTLSATGQGLSMVLDANGQGAVTWSFVGDDLGGTASVHAGVASGAAHGSATVSVDGDARPPQVMAFSPAGATSAEWSTLQLGFNESIYAGSVTEGAFTLLDPEGASVAIESAELTSDRWITVTPAVPADGSLGVWTLTVASSIRDDGGGNFLSGDWSGSPADFTLSFGDLVDSAPPVLSCAASSSRFRPDGDHGVGVDADAVSVQVTAAQMPMWWWMEISNNSGEVVQWLPVAATGLSETLEWDGRGADGRVVDAGAYTLSTTALDTNLARSSGCDAHVEVEHPIDLPGVR